MWSVSGQSSTTRVLDWKAMECRTQVGLRPNGLGMDANKTHDGLSA